MPGLGEPGCMRPRFGPSTLIALLAVAAVVPALGAASPMPVPVCQPCSFGFEQAVNGDDTVPESVAGDDVAVVESTATVRVFENGTAVWEMRNRLSDPAVVEYLRTHPEALQTVAEDAWLVGDASVASVATVDDDTVVLRYRVADFATRSNGVLRVDYFRDEPGRYAFYELGADRLTLIGPDDTRVTSGLPGATVDGNELTVTEYRSGGDGPFVVFGPEDDPLGGAKTHAAIAAAVGGIVARNLLLLVVVPGLVLAGGTWAAGVAAGRDWLTTDRERARQLGGVVAAVGLVVALLSALVGTEVVGGTYETWGVLGGLAIALSAGTVAFRPDTWTLRRLVALVVTAAAVGTVAASAGAALLDGRAIAGAMGAASGAVLVTLWMLVVGAARDAGGRTRSLVLAVPPVVFGVAVAASTSLASTGGALFLVVPVVYVGVALVAVAAGVPLLALGASVPTSSDDGAPPRAPQSGHAVE